MKFRAVKEKLSPMVLIQVTPAIQHALQIGYTEQLALLQQRKSEAIALERRLSELVDAACNLTPEEVTLL